MKLVVILGPTASGKTQLAVALAKRINGAIISADSRQVYRDMNLGTGKDLEAYGDIPYHLIDVVDAGETYHVTRYREDVYHALDTIKEAGKQPILCGGTGLYIQSIVQGFTYDVVPVNATRRTVLESSTIELLRERLQQLPMPPDFVPDTSTRKRLIRAIEIAEWCQHHPLPLASRPALEATIFGINPPVAIRRQRITARLQQRLDMGLLDEVKALLHNGVSPDRLVYYGLEYKYAVQYLLGELDEETFFARLNTEIHRFAKRQMTYFRKMEKDGLHIHWLAHGTIDEMASEILKNDN
ncbi:tRNA (adenosine(37)-N6)-dimethylallyltransferase MiaA [Parapedobacter koreensis]|uniref:tRNA dimethylallyltransferase n=1 Tax=Parapedobacter koreensis TaxID=332977 RepID=A0A1H7Q8V3_9SPHI|nr:tRNA (adenosine(37)-N6)-dimethylallyltransferase MiaA [Parapedobacter koreensis]SEL44229.1 tRNA dimethylallyltransferase [Parapedobacter koreensis]